MAESQFSLRQSFLLIISTASLLLLLFGFLPLGATLDESKYHLRDGIHAPCTFFDTVNVTDDKRFPNGSVLHDGVLIPRQYVALYDYVYHDLIERVEVAPHYRGCVCKVKPCVNLCCPWGMVYQSNTSSCENATTYLWPAKTLNVTFANDTKHTVNIFEQFAVQNFRPCNQMFSLQPEIYYYDEWLLFENGTMLRTDDNVFISKNEFCLVPTVVNDTDLYYVINPANCDVKTEYGTVKIINAYTMIFSIPFMVLTIFVYLLIPELRNQHGKSLVCYLIGLSIGYTAISCVLLINDLSPYSVTCKVVGYTAYYFFMSAFLWLSVISFDLWHNFRGTRGINRFQEKKRFLYYSLYSWGLAFLFLVFTWCAQNYLGLPRDWAPSIGDGFYCWLDMHNWSAMIYFYGPILAIIVANTIMFIMTAMKIHTVQREMARIIAREDSTKNLRTEKDKFGLFLRLFIIMGVTWSSEIISYFIGNDKKVSKIFYITDICNAMQGFLIFMLFVMKKKVKHLITNRTVRVRSYRQTESSTFAGSTSMRQRFRDASLQIRKMIVIRSAFTTTSNVHSHTV